ncbi:hypothetical protein [Paenibacillus sp. S150]|nr:hypothetical protein [Paenibacillus sp. S150]
MYDPEEIIGHSLPKLRIENSIRHGGGTEEDGAAPSGTYTR